MGTNSQTPFIWGQGTSNNGLLTSAITLMTTELNTLGSGSVAVSSSAYNNSNTLQATLGDIYLTLSASVTTTAGAVVSGWFLTSPDGGTTYEQSTLAPPRAPDFTIPLLVGALSSPFVYKSVGVHKVIVPATYFKVLLQNNTGVAWPASSNTLKLAVVSLDY